MPERYQDEIEEILRQAGESPPDENSRDHSRADDQVVAPVRATGRTPATPDAPARRWPRITPGKLMLLGLVLFVVGALWFKFLIWVGLGLVVIGYLLFFVTPRSIRVEKRWRGQVVEESVSPLERLKRWLMR